MIAAPNIVEMPNTQTAELDQIPDAPASSYPRNDSESAELFAARFGDELRYVANWKSWLRWNGNRWRRDEGGEVMRLGQEIPKALFAGALEIEEDEDKRKKVFGAACQAGNAARLHAMIELAGVQAGIAARPRMFDAEPYLLGVENGVIDLRAGSFREAKKEDYITKQARTEYNRDARCPLWIEHLRKVFAGDESLISFFQCAVGYSLTGDTRAQVLFFLYGTGRNGKSTTTETLQTMLGDYAQRAPAALFVVDKSGREPQTEIARLMGARLVVGSEIEEGAKLAESRVKDLTGQDTLTGRFLYSSAFDFKPSHKLWIFGNHKPDIRGTDLGIWRRMRLIPFNVQIGESEIDPQLPVKLLGELPGILNWAVDGCSIWQKQGLSTPHAVTSATTEYRDEEDELGEFIGEKCVVESGAEIEKKELFYAYRGWADGQGIRLPLTLRKFGKRIGSRGGISDRQSNGKDYWVGIRERCHNGTG
jgi:putative DNA primase/helicase